MSLMSNKQLLSTISSELKDVPLLRNASNTQKVTISKSLQLSEESRKAMETHVGLVGIDKNRFQHTPDEQSKFYCQAWHRTSLTNGMVDKAFELITRLGIHIPDVITRDVRSKLSIQTSARKTVTSKSNKNNKYTRITRLYQCLCGTDTSGEEEKRQIGWSNVGCSVWVHVVTTHGGAQGTISRITIIVCA
jgi:hypothetical protein